MGSSNISQSQHLPSVDKHVKLETPVPCQLLCLQLSLPVRGTSTTRRHCILLFSGLPWLDAVVVDEITRVDE